MPTSKTSPTAGETGGDPESTPAAPTVAETNFPDSLPVEDAAEADKAPERNKGETWSTWNGTQPGERILTVRDLKELGDKEATEPLRWDRENRWTLEISDVHPMVEKYIEFQDGSFTVERF